MLNLNQQIDSMPVEGKVYVDLEAMLDCMFIVTQRAMDMAWQTRDTELATMVLGMVEMGKGMEMLHAEMRKRDKLPERPEGKFHQMPDAKL